jgi:hypothetical protein
LKNYNQKLNNTTNLQHSGRAILLLVSVKGVPLGVVSVPTVVEEMEPLSTGERIEVFWEGTALGDKVSLCCACIPVLSVYLVVCWLYC